MNISIVLNGERISVLEGTNISALIERLELHNNPNVVELNGSFLECGKYDYIVKENDRVFIRNFVGGG